MGFHPPAELNQAIDPQAPVYISLFGKSDGTTGRGFIAKVSNPGLGQTGIQRWETNESDDLKNLFILNLSKAFTPGFNDNTYNGVAIRFRNFPESIQTIDYALITAPNGETYAVFTNSKDHIFVLIDAILSQTKGK